MTKPGPVERFVASMAIDHEKWHDGIGYDLAAIDAASPTERTAIEQILLARGARDWRDVEALARLDTLKTRATLKDAIGDGSPDVRSAILDHGAALFEDRERAAVLIGLVRDAAIGDGLTRTLGEIEHFHPPPVIEALLRAILEREGAIAVHFAAMAMFLHAKAAEPFDDAQRPFFLRFATESRGERRVAFRDLCERIGVDAAPYLRKR